MFSNYFKIALRNLWKNKVYSGINIFGLTLGMALAILIGLWLYSEFSYNSYYKHGDRIGQFMQTQTFNAQTATSNSIPIPLKAELEDKYNRYFKQLGLSSWTNPYYIQHKNESFSITGNFWEPSLLSLFRIEVTKGKENPLAASHSIMLSESAAQTIFGDKDPIGQLVKVNSSFTVEVTAVYKDIPENNTLNDIDYIMPWSMNLEANPWMKDVLTRWGNNSFQLYAELADNISLEQVNTAIEFTKKDASEETRQYNPRIEILTFSEGYLYGSYENGVRTGGRIEYVRLIGIIGFIVLILACINFMNLSTARSERRSLEVGIRKTLGSTRGQIIGQFLAESFFIVCIAFVLALILANLTLDGFNSLAAKEVIFPWSNWQFWVASFAFIVFTALLAGSYPALYLSSFKPILVLKGLFKVGKLAALPRKVLVVTQFAISIGLIVGTIVIAQQIQHSKDRPRGYSSANLIEIPTMSEDFEGQYDRMRKEFTDSEAVVEMGAARSPLTTVWSNRSGYTWNGKDPGFQEDFAYIIVSPEYAETIGMEFVAGRNFDRTLASDSNAVILNETAVRYMGLQNPIGMEIRDEDEEEPNPPMKVIGVVKDVLMQSPYEPVKQTMFTFNRDAFTNYYLLRLNGNNSTSQNIATVESIFKKNFPQLPFSYSFVDEDFGEKFASEERVAKLAGTFTVLAIIISCLGLFGLTSYVAEQRTKEIGIRKVLGASVQNLWLLISKDFLLLVGLALVIGIPIAFYFLSNWLQKFPYRIEISWVVFALAALGAFAITLLTVSFQTLKSAYANPVNSLRSE